MLSGLIANKFSHAIAAAIADGSLGALTTVPENLTVELPKNPEHGDRAISIAMRLTKEAKIPPRAVAEAIVAKLDRSIFEAVDIAGPGFINLKLNWAALSGLVSEIHAGGDVYGRRGIASASPRNDDGTPRNDSGVIASGDSRAAIHDGGEKILVEYVSVNPTGDVHIGHGRQAVYGSALVSLLRWAGYDVSSEFYINDAGAQMMKLGQSVRAAILINEGLMAEKDYPEDGYPLDSMQEFITREQYRGRLGDCFASLAMTDESGLAMTDESGLAMTDESGLAMTKEKLEALSLSDYAALGREIFIEAHKEILAKIGVEFDTWFSENIELYGSQGAKPTSPCAVTKTCELLTKAGFTYEADDALWFRATDLGDERDRVFRKADGYYTYLAGDLAYHYNKLKRGYDRLINIWGADHHGQIPSLSAGLLALAKAGDLNFTREQIEVPLIQMVSLQKGGVEYKMSKRSGNLVTVRDLYKEVGADAMRYFLAESQITNHMVFDMELATKKDKDNPVYYVQYAHARCCSILRTLVGEQMNIGDAVTEPRLEKAVLTKSELESMASSFNSDKDIFSGVFAALEGDSARSTRALILALLHFPEEIAQAALARAPHKIAHYLKELAGLFHQFYTHNRVIVEDRALMQARISLVVATRIVLANALAVLGVSAPEKM